MSSASSSARRFATGIAATIILATGSGTRQDSRNLPHARAQTRRFATLAVVLTLVTVGAAGCGRNPQVLPDEAFRNVVPANAQLSDEIVDDGSSIIQDGERSVLRIFVPTPPTEAAEVLATLVEEGESDGWVFNDHSPTLAVGTKEIDGRLWMVSLSVRDYTVRQLFAGR